ncbi:hypothetical protein AGOR_G00082710 [Albula goreensis]|uniref:PH domain-containing protein n=1 Tax=Albula goreensis TaxID=1534307 RepID=A0A8T3DML3_9TELE|nr:hypothetical protein AGOR_G00082710 [Albula goreensis]
MSRRRISVKELGQVDCQGWLYRKKEGKAFLGIKWKKYWFVLKKTSLYWYTSQMAEKAVGYISLADFTIEQAVECKRKHAMKACNPKIMTFYFAAESSNDMNRWLNKLQEVSTQNEVSERNSEECYSEASDHEEVESTDPVPPSNPKQTSTTLVSFPPPSPSPSTCDAGDSGSSPFSAVAPQNSASANHSKSWLEISTCSSPEVCSSQDASEYPPQTGGETCRVEGSQSPPSSQDTPVIMLSGDLHKEEVMSLSPVSAENDIQRGTSDEMEKLYIHLKHASLSPTGERKPCTKKEFRSSFIKRCKNHTLNEKLHVVRTLNSTLKAKEADLLTIEQVLAESNQSAARYRQWKEANVVLLQEIFNRQNPQGANPEQPAATAQETFYSETSV